MATTKGPIDEHTKSGRSSNASDYVRDLFRRDQDRRTAVAELLGFVDKGLASGPAQKSDTEAFLAHKREDHAAKPD